MAASLASRFAKEALPPTLTSDSEQPPLNDGTTRSFVFFLDKGYKIRPLYPRGIYAAKGHRLHALFLCIFLSYCIFTFLIYGKLGLQIVVLYMSYICPYAQRAWITRNYKGLQEKIKLVPMDIADKPAWYKKLYPRNMVPSLEHNNKIIGESLDLIKYMDSNFEGPKLAPDDSEKQRLAEELLAYSDTFNQAMLAALTSKGAVTPEAVAALEKIERSLSKIDHGPFFLGQFSQVDIAYAPFVEGFQIFFAGIKNYDITAGRANIQKFIEEMNKIEAYTQTKQDPQEMLALTKKRLGI